MQHTHSQFDLHEFTNIQAQHRVWQAKEFGAVPPWKMVAGMIEEGGELTHSYLKSYEGVRGTKEELRAKGLDAVGDLFIFLLGFCSSCHLEFADIIKEAEAAGEFEGQGCSPIWTRQHGVFLIASRIGAINLRAIDFPESKCHIVSKKETHLSSEIAKLYHALDNFSVDWLGCSALNILIRTWEKVSTRTYEGPPWFGKRELEEAQSDAKSVGVEHVVKDEASGYYARSTSVGADLITGDVEVKPEPRSPLGNALNDFYSRPASDARNKAEENALDRRDLADKAAGRPTVGSPEWFAERRVKPDTIPDVEMHKAELKPVSLGLREVLREGVSMAGVLTGYKPPTLLVESDPVLSGIMLNRVETFLINTMPSERTPGLFMAHVNRYLQSRYPERMSNESSFEVLVNEAERKFVLKILNHEIAMTFEAIGIPDTVKTINAATLVGPMISEETLDTATGKWVLKSVNSKPVMTLAYWGALIHNRFRKATKTDPAYKITATEVDELHRDLKLELEFMGYGHLEFLVERMLAKETVVFKLDGYADVEVPFNLKAREDMIDPTGAGIVNEAALYGVPVPTAKPLMQEDWELVLHEIIELHLTAIEFARDEVMAKERVLQLAGDYARRHGVLIGPKDLTITVEKAPEGRFITLYLTGYKPVAYTLG